jgi:ribosome-binding factor A
MDSTRQKKVSELIRHLAAEYISREVVTPGILITVTRADVSADLEQSDIYITVLPDEKIDTTLQELRRHRTDFRTFVKPQLTTRTLPFFDFKIDLGEKHRQYIDELTQGI